MPCGAWSYALCVQDKIHSILISLRPKPNLSIWIQIYKRHKKQVNNCQGMLVEAMWWDGLCSRERIDGMFTSDSLLILFIFMLFFVHWFGWCTTSHTKIYWLDIIFLYNGRHVSILLKVSSTVWCVHNCERHAMRVN